MNRLFKLLNNKSVYHSLDESYSKWSTQYIIIYSCEYVDLTKSRNERNNKCDGHVDVRKINYVWCWLLGSLDSLDEKQKFRKKEIEMNHKYM